MNESAIGWAWRQSAASTDKLVLLALASVADSHGTATPTIATLASMCGVTRRSVQRTLSKLFAAGFVQSEARRRDDRSTMSNRYRLAVPYVEMSAKPDSERKSSAQLESFEPSYMSVTLERHEWRRPVDADVAALKRNRAVLASRDRREGPSSLPASRVVTRDESVGRTTNLSRFGKCWPRDPFFIAASRNSFIRGHDGIVAKQQTWVLKSVTTQVVDRKALGTNFWKP